MKRIEAVVRREKVPDVLAALSSVSVGVTVQDVLGHGVQRGVRERWRGEVYSADLLPKSMLTLVVPDEDAVEVVETIVASARTGRLGDGKVFVSGAGDVVRIRTGEHGDRALGGEA